MTTSAWVMLSATWLVVGFFTLRFFARILRAGFRGDAGPVDGGGQRRDR